MFEGQSCFKFIRDSLYLIFGPSSLFAKALKVSVEMQQDKILMLEEKFPGGERIPT